MGRFDIHGGVPSCGTGMRQSGMGKHARTREMMMKRGAKGVCVGEWNEGALQLNVPELVPEVLGAVGQATQPGTATVAQHVIHLPVV